MHCRQTLWPQKRNVTDTENLNVFPHYSRVLICLVRNNSHQWYWDIMWYFFQLERMLKIDLVQHIVESTEYSTNNLYFLSIEGLLKKLKSQFAKQLTNSSSAKCNSGKFINIISQSFYYNWILPCACAF